MERWAQHEQLDVICVTETRACQRGTEGGERKLIGDEEWGGDWKCFFMTGVDKKLVDEKDKLQR